MGTALTLAYHDGTDAEPAWRFSQEPFEAGAVYPAPRGVSVELQTLEAGGVCVVVRLPIGTAMQLGLHTSVLPSLWERTCDADKP